MRRKRVSFRIFVFATVTRLKKSSPNVRRYDPSWWCLVQRPRPPCLQTSGPELLHGDSASPMSHIHNPEQRENQAESQQCRNL